MRAGFAIDVNALRRSVRKDQTERRRNRAYWGSEEHGGGYNNLDHTRILLFRRFGAKPGLVHAGTVLAVSPSGPPRPRNQL